MEGTLNGRPGVLALAGTSSSGGHQHRNVEEESRQTSPSQGADVQYCRHPCRHQHDVLVTYIRYALRCWAPLDEAPLSYWMDGTVNPWTASSATQVTPELRRVLTRAKILCEECCKELPPLKAALRHAERSEAFADVLAEIQWCISVVYNGSICKNVRDPQEFQARLRDFPWQAKLGRQEQHFLQRAEQEDWLQLMQELGRWNASHWCSAEECGNVHAQGDPEFCLSTQILVGFLAQGLRVAHDQGSFLWSFENEVVQQRDKLLGWGSFGAVWEVTWLGCKYAQKVFNLARSHSLQTEKDAIAKMNHPHIVKVFAHSEDSLLMDLMCMDLHKFMEMRRRRPSMAGPFSLAAATDLMLQIADAVSHMHSRKLAHRDLKSANILVNPLNMPGLDGDDDDGFVFAKIADFGLAKVKREITRNSHLTHDVGTRKWMAPEIFGANLEDDPLEEAYPMKADVYSFGVICYEILSGEVPYSDVLPRELYAKLTAPFPLRPRLPASCPTGLASLICACWDADPRKRPEFANVCRVLRYLKGLPTLTNDLGDKSSIDGGWPFGRLSRWAPKVYLFDGQRIEGVIIGGLRMKSKNQIKGFRVHFSDGDERVLSTFELASDASMVFDGCSFYDLAPDDSMQATFSNSGNWTLFDMPCEFLVQVELSYNLGIEFGIFYSRAGLSTVTFITTTQKYGPFGTARIGDKQCCINLGRVVTAKPMLDFDWGRFYFIAIPEIVQCLQDFLKYEDPYA